MKQEVNEFLDNWLSIKQKLNNGDQFVEDVLEYYGSCIRRGRDCDRKKFKYNLAKMIKFAAPGYMQEIAKFIFLEFEKEIQYE